MIVGIDLGTTHSLISVWRDGRMVLIPNVLGETLTPSAVCVTEDGHALVGRAAREIWTQQPERCALTFKRHMGSRRPYRLGGKLFRPEDLSALVLKSLKADAEQFLCEPVTEAIITVPAYFSDAQRAATRLAGELAGFTVRRLVNEPTAAALAYGLQEAEAESIFLVIDLGGGTFDVAILERFEGLMEVRASTGDNFLGGEDFLRVLLDRVKHHWPWLPSEEDSPIYGRLWREAERVKRALGSQDSAEFTLEWQEQTYTQTITASDFEQACEPLLARFRRPIERALRDAKLDAARINQVVLAGGATRMPMIRRLVARMFGRMPAMNLNPDEVIAQGAAVMAGLVARDVALQEVVMVDVCPYSLGTEIMREMNGLRQSGHFDPIIERNTVVPVSREAYYQTSADMQSEVVIRLFQGEARLTKDNILLGELNISVPPRAAGEIQVTVRFTYDVSGILECEVRIPATDKMERLVLQNIAGTLSEAEVEQRLSQLAQLKIHPREQQINLTALARAERLHQELLGAPRREFAAHVLAFEAALAGQNVEHIATTRRHLEKLMDALERSDLR